jgi:hypothetical protein
MTKIVSYIKVGEDDVTSSPILLVRLLKEGVSLFHIICVGRTFYIDYMRVKDQYKIDYDKELMIRIEEKGYEISLEEALDKYKDTSVMLPFLRETRINKILND